MPRFYRPEVDRTIGQRIRDRRCALGITQTQLADVLGLSYQQIQKYETGVNSISAALLVEIARQLGVPNTYLLHDNN